MILAVLVSSLSALYARWALNEAKKANDIGRLSSLLAFRQHYLELMRHQLNLGETLKNSQSGMQAVQDTYSDLDTKLREVNKEIKGYHRKVVGNGTELTAT